MEYAGGEAGDVLGTGGILPIFLEEITPTVVNHPTTGAFKKSVWRWK
jgi:hypothetical protein